MLPVCCSNRSQMSTPSLLPIVVIEQLLLQVVKTLVATSVEVSVFVVTAVCVVVKVEVLVAVAVVLTVAVVVAVSTFVLVAVAVSVVVSVAVLVTQGPGVVHVVWNGAAMHVGIRPRMQCDGAVQFGHCLSVAVV